MNSDEYSPPKLHSTGFNCPHCKAFAHQRWNRLTYQGSNPSVFIKGLRSSTCAKCRKFAIWFTSKMVHPSNVTAPLAHKNMPDSVRTYYNEAREVSAASPRAAAALLRIAAKKLCEHLGESTGHLSQNISNLTDKGLPEAVVKSLHTVRIVGNEGGAHEGQIDLSDEDNSEIVNRLFGLVNFIVEKTIEDKKRVDEMFGALPKNKTEGVKTTPKKAK